MKYYLVGANWSGEKLNEDFFRRGYWEMGWDDSDQPAFANLRDAMLPGDRIAIKSMNGKGASTITIHAVGIVKEVYQKRVYIDWKLTDMQRAVPAHGCFATIHGPYDSDDNWIHQVFCL